MLKAAGQLAHPDRDAMKERKKAAKKQRREVIVSVERKARASTGIRSARESKVFEAPKRIGSFHTGEPRELKSPRNCYICKTEYTKMHFFYDALCMPCAEFNYEKRFQTADLSGTVALITGSRVKIGYQATLMLLRAGATVVATTRFPVDSL